MVHQISKNLILCNKWTLPVMCINEWFLLLSSAKRGQGQVAPCMTESNMARVCELQHGHDGLQILSLMQAQGFGKSQLYLQFQGLYRWQLCLTRATEEGLKDKCPINKNCSLPKKPHRGQFHPAVQVDCLDCFSGQFRKFFSKLQQPGKGPRMMLTLDFWHPMVWLVIPCLFLFPAMQGKQTSLTSSGGVGSTNTCLFLLEIVPFSLIPSLLPSFPKHLYIWVPSSLLWC